MFPSDYFDSGYWAAGYWGDGAEGPPPDIGSVQLAGTLDGVGGRINLRAVVVEEVRGGGGGTVRKQDVERMLRHIRDGRVRIAGTLDGVTGRFVAASVRRVVLHGTLDGVSGTVTVRHTFAAAVYDEDEELLTWWT